MMSNAMLVGEYQKKNLWRRFSVLLLSHLIHNNLPSILKEFLQFKGFPVEAGAKDDSLAVWADMEFDPDECVGRQGGVELRGVVAAVDQPATNISGRRRIVIPSRQVNDAFSVRTKGEIPDV